jgi:hypothetical protein
MTTDATMTTADLGKTMPDEDMPTITVEEHNKAFFIFDSTDVWATDGWLVVAVQKDGVTHHLRKGDKLKICQLAPTDLLHYIPNAKTEKYGYFN